MSDVKTFYDNYSVNQIETGINRRHRSIDSWLVKFNLKADDKVLEIGCGIGTQTRLIAERVTDGVIDAYDLSPASIKIAQSSLKRYKNVSFFAIDALEADLKENYYSYVVLPDVLEHIPEELHMKLFQKIASSLTENGRILAHIPDPDYNKYLRENFREKQQIIDQSLYLDSLSANIYSAGLHIQYLESYNLHATNGDYQVILIRKNRVKLYEPVIRSKTFLRKVLWKIQTLLKS